MRTSAPRPPIGVGVSGDSPLGREFAALFGLLLGIALLKFGNPANLAEYTGWPEGWLQWLITAWPPALNYWFLGAVILLGLFLAGPRRGVPLILVILPAAWLLWEFIDSAWTVDARLTRLVLPQFAASVACFYLGFFSLSRVRRLGWFWAVLTMGFVLVLVEGFDQHFGGLDATRKFFALYGYDQSAPRELAERLQSNRIFSTLFYANTLAGAIVMLLPPIVGVLASQRARLTPGARGLAIGVVSAAALACLYWSGSKGGWLLMLLVGLVGALFLPFDRRLKFALIGAVLVLGLAGFGLKYAGFFEHGAKSVVARFEYWRAAGLEVQAQPLTGSGPGTFSKSYAKYMRPTDEPTRLAHNDYIQQAADSGVPGFLLYTALVAGSLIYSARRGKLGSDWVRLGVWLGTFGWALHSLTEFHLYIPAMAWPAFTFMGWLVGQGANPSTPAALPVSIPIKQ